MTRVGSALTPSRVVTVVAVLGVLWLASVAAATLIGPVPVDIAAALDALRGGDERNVDYLIVFETRLPRLLLASVVGGLTGLTLALGLYGAAALAAAAPSIALGAAILSYAAAVAVSSAATAAWTPIQWALNAALTANPIGILVVALAALSAGLIYAFGCELYLFLSTFSLASISSNILAELRLGPLTEGELARRYASERMVRLRIERLLAAGLMVEADGAFQLTPKGAHLVGIFERLRALFGH